jgi:hypothetical protein
MKRLLFTLVLAAALAACATSGIQPEKPVTDHPSTGEPVINPDTPDKSYSPQPGDSRLLRGNVYLDNADLLVLESFPVQYRLALSGNLPDPCHQLRVDIHVQAVDHRIEVDVYSVADPAAVCIQILKPFQASIPLDLTSLSPGHYTVWANGDKVGEFDL